MLKIIVVGAGGRMGSEIVRFITLQSDMELIAGVEAGGHPLIGKHIGSGIVVSELAQVIEKGDVVVDFSTPQSVTANLRLCAKARRPFITGVTGFSERDVEEMKLKGEKIPIVYAPNFSMGIAVLRKLVEVATSILGQDWDIHIIETHHKKKKDAPSGTARLIEEGIKEKLMEKSIGVSAIRIGDVIGEHRVLFAGAGEILELYHRAESRVAFASGVIAAIRWIVGKNPGFYSIADVLKIN